MFKKPRARESNDDYVKNAKKTAFVYRKLRFTVPRYTIYRICNIVRRQYDAQQI